MAFGHGHYGASFAAPSVVGPAVPVFVLINDLVQGRVTLHGLQSKAMPMYWESVSGSVIAGVKWSASIFIAGGPAGSSVLRHRCAYRLPAVSFQPQMLAWSQPSSGNGCGPRARIHAMISSSSSTAATSRLSRMPQRGPVSHSLGLVLRLRVALAGGCEHAFSGPYFRLGWLEDRVSLGFPDLPGGAFVFPVGVLVRNHDVLAGLQLIAEHAPLFLQIGQPARLDGEFAGRLGFGGLQWADLPVGVAAAEFEVGLDGEPAAAFGELVPEVPLLHYLTHGCFVPAVLGFERPRRGGDGGVSGRDGRVGGDAGLSFCADGLEPHRPRAQAHVLELLADMRWCPAGLALIAAAHVLQAAVGQLPHIHTIPVGDGGERIVPGGAHLRRGLVRLLADDVPLIADAVQLAVGGNFAGPLLPVEPVHRILGHRPKRLDRPRRRRFGRVFAEAPGPLIHRLPKRRFMLCDLGVAELARPVGPGFLRRRHKRLDDVAHALVQHPGHAANAGQSPWPRAGTPRRRENPSATCGFAGGGVLPASLLAVI